MKYFKTLIIAASVCVVSLFVFCFFRTVPVSRLWKGYQVLYVDSNTLSEADILSILQESGCKNVVSSAQQQIPIVSQFSPIQVQSPDSYLSRRSAFFTDESTSLLVCYIPEGQDMAMSRALHTLNEAKNTVAGTDGAASFPWGSPIVCVLFAALCLLFAKNRLAFAPAAFFLVLFSLSRPLFTTGAAVCLALYGFFMLQKIWGRRGFYRSANTPLVILCMLVPAVLLCVSSPVSSLFYVFALTAGFSAILLVDILKSLYYERRMQVSFKPVLIRGAAAIPLVERKEIKLILSLCAAVLVIMGVSFMGKSLASVSFDSAQPALPAPTTGRSVLPDLDDFMAWSWNTITFPYRRMTMNAGEATTNIPVDGESVSIPEYAEVNGVLQETAKTMYVYNSSFRNSVYESVKNLPYPALEKMLLKQGKDTRYAYAKGGGVSGERWGTLLLLLFALIPASIVVYFVVIRRQYGISF